MRDDVSVFPATTAAGERALMRQPSGAVTVTGANGSQTLPVGVADLPDGVVWAPTTSSWSAAAGSDVRLSTADGAGA